MTRPRTGDRPLAKSDTVYEKLATNLRELREFYGLRVSDVGNDLGVGAPAISRWETGANAPVLRHLVMLAEYYEVSVDDLLGRGTSKSIVRSIGRTK